MSTLTKHTRHGRYDLSEQEIEAKRLELSQLVEEIREKEAQLSAAAETVKNIKAHITSRQDDLKKTNRPIMDGYEQRPLECYRLKDYHRRVTQYWSIKFRRVVEEVAFSFSDNQIDMPMHGDMVEFETFGEAVQKYTDAINIDGRWFSFGEFRTDWNKPRNEPIDNTAEAIQAMTGLTVNTDGLDKALNESDTTFVGENLIDKPFDREQSTLKSCALFCDMVAKANEKQLAKLRKSKPALSDADIAACVAWAAFHDLPF